MRQDETIFLPSSSKRGVVLIHGFTGSPSEMFDLGKFLNENNFQVEIPILPGHGTKPEDLNQIKKEDWIKAVNQSVERMFSVCDEISLIGLSLGAMLAIIVASQTKKIKSLICISSPYWIHNRWKHSLLSFLDKTSLWKFIPLKKINKNYHAIQYGENRFSYDIYPFQGIRSLVQTIDEAKTVLFQIQQPVFFIHSQSDSISSFKNLNGFLKKLPKQPTILPLKNFNHVITCDPKRAEIFPDILNFLNNVK